MSSILFVYFFKTGSSLSFLSILCSFCVKSTASSSALNMPSAQERSNLISNPHFFPLLSPENPQSMWVQSCLLNHWKMGMYWLSDSLSITANNRQIILRSFFPPPLGSEMRLKTAPWSWRFIVLPLPNFEWRLTERSNFLKKGKWSGRKDYNIQQAPWNS